MLKFIKKYKKVFANKVLVLDNVAFHKQSDVIHYLKSIDCKTEFIVPYHSELNPIEEVFSLLKHYVRKHLPITYEDYENAIKNSVTKITSDKIKNYYKHSFT